MGGFVPVFLAFLINSFGITVFKDVTNISCGPLLSGLIFLFSEFIVLWSLPLYPRNLRKLGKLTDFILELLTALFLMEYIFFDFWNPVENFVMTVTPKIGDYLYDFLKSNGIGYSFLFWEIAEFLKCDVAAVLNSYITSIFFLCCSLHATRILDFRLLGSGCKIFGRDAVLRLKKLKFKIQQYFLGKKTNIKFKDPVKVDCCPSNLCHLDAHHKPSCPKFRGEFVPHIKHTAPTKDSKNVEIQKEKCEAKILTSPSLAPTQPNNNNKNNVNDTDSEVEYSDSDCEEIVL